MTQNKIKVAPNALNMVDHGKETQVNFNRNGNTRSGKRSKDITT